MEQHIADIEAALGCRFPRRFTAYLAGLQSEEIIFRLFDNEYRVLSTLTKGEGQEIVWDEHVVFRSKLMDDKKTYPEDEGWIKLPFARVLAGDGYIYLYFLCRPGEESPEDIYARDTDSPWAGRIKVSNSIDWLKGDISREGGKATVDCRNKKFLDVCEMMPPCLNISYWGDDFDIRISDNINELENQFTADKYAEVFEWDEGEGEEGAISLEVQLFVVCSTKTIHSSKRYMIGIIGLKTQLLPNYNYRIFYHKFICVMDCLKHTMSAMVKEGITSKEAFNDFVDMKTLIKETKSPFLTC